MSKTPILVYHASYRLFGRTLCWLARATIVVPLVGCGASALSPRVNNPVIEGYVNQGAFGRPSIGTLATTADRRLIAVALDGERKHMYCAEPMPDALTNAIATIAGKVSADTKEDIAKLDLTFEQKTQLITTALYQRSHSIQWERDAEFSLCNAVMNGLVDSSEYKRLRQDIIDKSYNLILREIDRDSGGVVGRSPKSTNQSVPSKPPGENVTAEARK